MAQRRTAEHPGGEVEVQVGPSWVTIHSDDRVIVCDSDSRMSSGLEQGFFARDTRFISGYRVKLGREAPVLINSSDVEHYSSRFEFTNPELDVSSGHVAAGSLHLRIDRTVGRGVHEDYEVTNFSGKQVNVELEVSFESDFADIFDVKQHRLVRRGALQSTWDENSATIRTTYANGPFRRAISIRATNAGSDTEFANGGLHWRLGLDPGDTWHTCLLWSVALDGWDVGDPADTTCHALEGRATDHDRMRREWIDSTTSFRIADPSVDRVVGQAVEDLSSLRVHREDDTAAPWDEADAIADSWVPAAGIPWFVSLFGRDSLVVSLQTLCLSPRFALGALRALGRLQGDGYDDARDMQPGKIEHEIRHGELASLHLVPHTPYYGTHDATALFVWAAARSWWWHGDRRELDTLRDHVERCLAWIDRDGDPDGDGLQEYKTRATTGGYYNQGWKDSGDAIVDEKGDLASLPIALCEQQGYVVAAKRAWADVIESVYGEAEAAAELRDAAGRLADLIERRFWWEEEGTYFLGLDGEKRPLRSVSSNPGQLLWSSAVRPERARRVAKRLLARDMWSGWGVRTLSSEHPAYNPFSYQLGSVWPHDNVIFAAGLRGYGLEREAQRVIRAIFDAAARFRSSRLPELFAGLERQPGSFPAQYLGANVPQAWAAAAVIHALQVLLGLEADAPARTLRLNPALPAWLNHIRLQNVGLGAEHVDFAVHRREDGSYEVEVHDPGRCRVVLDDANNAGGARGRTGASSS